jgi:hypothetical protein
MNTFNASTVTGLGRYEMFVTLLWFNGILMILEQRNGVSDLNITEFRHFSDVSAA